jgi:hypothetical protein
MGSIATLRPSLASPSSQRLKRSVPWLIFAFSAVKESEAFNIPFFGPLPLLDRHLLQEVMSETKYFSAQNPGHYPSLICPECRDLLQGRGRIRGDDALGGGTFYSQSLLIKLKCGLSLVRRVD